MAGLGVLDRGAVASRRGALRSYKLIAGLEKSSASTHRESLRHDVGEHVDARRRAGVPGRQAVDGVVEGHVNIHFKYRINLPKFELISSLGDKDRIREQNCCAHMWSFGSAVSGCGRSHTPSNARCRPATRVHETTRRERERRRTEIRGGERQRERGGEGRTRERGSNVRGEGLRRVVRVIGGIA